MLRFVSSSMFRAAYLLLSGMVFSHDDVLLGTRKSPRWTSQQQKPSRWVMISSGWLMYSMLPFLNQPGLACFAQTHSAAHALSVYQLIRDKTLSLRQLVLYHPRNLRQLGPRLRRVHVSLADMKTLYEALGDDGPRHILGCTSVTCAERGPHLNPRVQHRWVRQRWGKTATFAHEYCERCFSTDTVKCERCY